MAKYGTKLFNLIAPLIFGHGQEAKHLGNPANPPADTDIINAFCTASQQPLRFIGKISQTGSSNPTLASIIVNNTGTPTMARSSAGTYTATKTGAFAGTVVPKTVTLFASGAVIGRMVIVKTNSNVVTITTYDTSNVLTDGLLTSVDFVLEVIPTNYLA